MDDLLDDVDPAKLVTAERRWDALASDMELQKRLFTVVYAKWLGRTERDVHCQACRDAAGGCDVCVPSGRGVEVEFEQIPIGAEVYVRRETVMRETKTTARTTEQVDFVRSDVRYYIDSKLLAWNNQRHAQPQITEGAIS